jgi:hypothetical protein
MKTTISIYRLGGYLILDLRVRLRPLPSFKLLIPWPAVWLARLSHS